MLIKFALGTMKKKKQIESIMSVWTKKRDTCFTMWCPINTF